MDTEDLLIYEGCEREKIKYIGAVPPYIERTELTKAFIVESIVLCSLPGFMVASDSIQRIYSITTS